MSSFSRTKIMDGQFFTIEDYKSTEEHLSLVDNGLDIYHIASESLSTLDEVNSTIESLIILEDERRSILKKSEITIEDFNGYKKLLRMSMVRYPEKDNAIEVAMEGYSDYRMALEQAGTEHLSILKRAMHVGADAIRNMFQSLVFYISFFEDSARDFSDLAESVKKLTSMENLILNFQSIDICFMEMRKNALLLKNITNN